MVDLRPGFRLGDRRVLPRQNRIEGPDGAAHVEPKVMEVLVCLAEHAGEVVSRDTFHDAVWGGGAVTDQALTNCVSELRRELGDSPSDPRFIATVPKRGYRLVAPVEPLEDEAPAPATADEETGRWTPPAAWLVGVAVGLVLAGGGALAWWWLLAPDGEVAGAGGPVAVVALPFENLEGAEELSYLRLALPDEVTTVLARTPSLAVRPFEPRAVDEPIAAGRAAGATAVVRGHYYIEGGERLNVTLEAIDVPRERVVWRSRVAAPVEDVLALRERIAAEVRSGLLPALGAGAAEGPGPLPADAEAYELYLKSLAVSRDPEPNRRGIELLERALELDPSYAPAWSSLALRHHRAASYAGGGDRALEQARRAARRAVELDPRLMAAAGRLVQLQVEAGELVEAHRRAREMIRRREASAQAHFALAYVLRYGGLLEESQRQCEMTLALDPYYHGWRSCAFSYMATGELDRAQHFIALDPGSYWSNMVSAHLLLRRDDSAGGLRFARRLPPEGADRRFLEACLAGRRGAELDGPAGDLVERWRPQRDPEPGYWIGALLAHCGRRSEGLALLEHAVDGNYCSYPAIDRDPVWEGLRDDPELERIRGRARACRERFLEATGPLS